MLTKKVPHKKLTFFCAFKEKSFFLICSSRQQLATPTQLVSKRQQLATSPHPLLC